MLRMSDQFQKAHPGVLRQLGNIQEYELHPSVVADILHGVVTQGVVDGHCIHSHGGVLTILQISGDQAIARRQRYRGVFPGHMRGYERLPSWDKVVLLPAEACLTLLA